MGQVYLARATGLGGFERQVVVKTLDLNVTDDDEAFVTMFLDEARLVGALHHQYIAPVYEVGCDESGRYYLVMDYVHGETAEAVFRATNERAESVPLAFSLTVVSCIASALDYAHSLCSADGTPLDIVHRDVSLSNVMIGYDGGVKLIDFGIAKAANRATKTQVGTLKGKIGYLAPEQILRKNVDHRADIFALGIVLYELTTSTRAFRETSDLITLERITNGEIKPPSHFIPGYPPELEAIVMKALETQPGRRFQDAGTMGRALEALASRRGIALGHAPIVGVMNRLFGDRPGRRRLARSSNEVQTDRSLAAAAATATEPSEDETSTVVATDAEVDTAKRKALPAPRESLYSRSLRPTMPIVGSRETPIPLEDQPTHIKSEAMIERALHARIPFEDRPTPIPNGLRAPRASADLPSERPKGNGFLLIDVSTRAIEAVPAEDLALSEHTTAPLGTRSPTGPQPVLSRPPTGPQLPLSRPPTGPQLPEPMALDLEAATVLSETTPEREDPTDVSGTFSLPSAPPTTRPPTPMPLMRPIWNPTQLATSVASRLTPDPATQKWFLLCALFAVAVMIAILTAIV